MDALNISGLYKSFGDKEVLCGLDLVVPEHSIFGFIGKNGSGKTTTMKTVLGLLKADSGEISVCGERVVYGQTATNKYIGYLPDVPEFYGFMSAPEYLAFCGEISDLDKKDASARIPEVLSLVGLEGENGKIKGFSRGMKQRLGIAQALLGRPKLLICDEPTSALDPIGRKEILDLLLSLKDQTTVLFSTHVLSDVERICTDVAFLNNGKIEKIGKIGEIKAKYRRDEFKLETEDAEGALALESAFPTLRRLEGNVLVFSEGESLEFQILRFIADKEIPIVQVQRTEPTLEGLFMEVSGK